ncbi:hypothetical protein XELAEV_18008923mg [Xenopus laevis]|uniref:Uncharacterized protein n=1 Tax=Xenopus laevis TaxID=8355 RepID=A0A974DTE9_XENLA|nr:hypothetical protein XELAEV_18008923mg [Xenopus laevis]
MSSPNWEMSSGTACDLPQYSGHLISGDNAQSSINLPCMRHEELLLRCAVPGRYTGELHKSSFLSEISSENE